MNVSRIVQSHFATFYRYDTNEPVRLWPRFTIIVVVSLALACFTSSELKDLYAGILNAVAIFVGFGLNVLIYMLSVPRKVVDTKTQYLEEENTVKKINALTDEVFYNIAYFNLMAISSVILTLILLAPWQTLSCPDTVEAAKTWCALNKEAFDYWAKMLADILRFVSKTIAFLLLTEVLFTAVRTVTRITYLFEERLKV